MSRPNGRPSGQNYGFAVPLIGPYATSRGPQQVMPGAPPLPPLVSGPAVITNGAYYREQLAQSIAPDANGSLTTGSTTCAICKRIYWTDKAGGGSSTYGTVESRTATAAQSASSKFAVVQLAVE